MQNLPKFVDTQVKYKATILGAAEGHKKNFITRFYDSKSFQVFQAGKKPKNLVNGMRSILCA
jgi:hypothetical protein